MRIGSCPDTRSSPSTRDRRKAATQLTARGAPTACPRSRWGLWSVVSATPARLANQTLLADRLSTISCLEQATPGNLESLLRLPGRTPQHFERSAHGRRQGGGDSDVGDSALCGGVRNSGRRRDLDHPDTRLLDDLFQILPYRASQVSTGDFPFKPPDWIPPRSRAQRHGARPHFPELLSLSPTVLSLSPRRRSSFPRKRRQGALETWVNCIWCGGNRRLTGAGCLRRSSRFRRKTARWADYCSPPLHSLASALKWRDQHD